MQSRWPTVDPDFEDLNAPPDFNIDLTLHFDNTLPPALLKDWESRCNGSHLPARSDFDMESLRPYLGWICLQRVNPDRSDMTYALVGSKVVHSVGRDSTGQTISETLPVGAWRISMQLLECPRPLRVWGPASWRNKEFLRHEALLLPLAKDGVTVDQLMVMAMFY